MSFYLLKFAAIQCLDEISPADVWPAYGGTLTDETKLDDIELTKAKRRIKAKPVNEFFAKRYKQDWQNVSSDAMGDCATIGGFIMLMAQHAKVSPLDTTLAGATAGRGGHGGTE